MNVINYRVSLDMLDVLSQTTIKAKKGDSACKIHITLAKNGKIYKISEGCHATFSAKKSDGNFIYDNCTIEGDTIVYDFASSIDKNGVCQVSACEGTVECEVALFKGVEQLTSPRFTLVIDSTVYNGEEIVSSPEVGVLKELINETEATVQNIEKKLADGEFKGEKGEQGDKGEPFTYDDFTEEQLASLKGEQGDKGDRGEQGIQGIQGVQGEVGAKGDKGDKGDKGKDADMSIVTNALKGNASGNIVALKDVSPLQHDINVQLDNGESVTVRSKNLFDKSKSINDGIKNETAVVTNTTASYVVVMENDGLIQHLKPNVKYTLSYEVECLSVPENATYIETAVGLSLRNRGISGAVANPYYRQLKVGDVINHSVSFTLTEERYENGKFEMLGYCNNYTDNTSGAYVKPSMIIRNIQIEEGATATEYEPYIEPKTYTADADGKLTIPSIYPSMTIVADEGATMSVEYNRDINKLEFSGTPNLDNYYTKGEIDGIVGDIETALDNIITMQNSYIGGAE